MKLSVNLIIVGICLSNITQLSGQTIAMDQLLDELKQVHPLFEKERLKVQINRQEQEGYLGAEDWNAITSVNFLREKPVIALSSPERTDAFSMAGGVQRAFWKTGGRLSVSLSSSYANIEIDPIYQFPSSFYQNEFAVTYTHPLLKNRGGFLDRLQYDLKQFDIDFSEVQAVENQEDFLAMVAGKYLDWVLLTEQKQIIQDRLKLSEGELVRTKEKREANLINQVDVLRAEDAVRIARQNQVLVESRWNALQSELAILSMNSDIFEVGPEFDLDIFVQLMTFEEASTYLNGNSRLLRALNVRLDQLKYVRRGYEETLKPDLSLITQLNTKQLDENLGDSFKMSKTDAFVGLQFSVPLENRTAKSQIAQSDLQTNQLKKELLDLRLTLTSTLINIYIQIEEMEEVLRLNKEQIESAKVRTEEELKLYNQGRGDLTFVIQSQDSEQNAKLTYAVNAVTYHKLIIAYRSLMDQLLGS